MNLRTAFSRLINNFHKNHRDLDAELSTHLQLHIDDHCRQGLSPQEARRLALLKLGGLEQTKQLVRDQQSIPIVESLFHDARFALRLLRKSPTFTAVAILTLALGIGADTAIFSVVNSVLLRSLPFPHPNELIDISARSTLFDFPNLGLSLPDIADLRNSSTSFSAIAVHQDSPKELSAAGDAKPQRLECTEVSEDFFPLLGIGPLHGRAFTSADMQPGNRTVILSYELWRENFAADPNAIGKIITLDGQPHSVIGVMPAQPLLGFATDSKLWTPFLPTKDQLADRSNHAYSVLARMKPHTNVARAQLELATISDRLSSAYPDVDNGWSIHATSLKQNLLGDARTPLTILFCAVGFVLLIACANVSNLFLARGWARRREFAIRAAIGASRAVLLRQLAVEPILVALAGGACAFLIANWTTHALRLALPPDIPRLDQIQIDAPVGLFTLAASLFAALLAGLAPAVLTTHGGGGSSDPCLSDRRRNSKVLEDAPSFAPVAKSGLLRSKVINSFLFASRSPWQPYSLDPTKQSTSTPHNFLRQLLVVGEVALAAILLIGAALALRSFNQLRSLDPGFRPDHLLTLRLDFPKFRFATPEQGIAFVQQVLDGTRATPGVAAASAGLVYPMSDEIAETTFETEATAADPKHAEQSSLANRVAPDFFHTLGIPLLAGRDFAAGDAKGKSPVFVVNETLAKKYFGGLDAVGKRLSTDLSGHQPVWGQIIGIAGNVEEANHFDPQDVPKPQVYAPFYQTPRVVGVYLMVRAKSDPAALVPALQDRIWSIEKNQPITAVATLDQRISAVNASPRSQTLLLGIFAALGFALALIGVYGVMSYLVGLQTREIGIRMALGAAPGQVLRRILAHGIKLTLAGVAIGTLCGLVWARFMASIFFKVAMSDPLTYTTVAVLLTAVAAAACYIPARRASRVDPAIALHHD
jgi:ABC-type antimicrobial peptide transport system permease subunit